MELQNTERNLSVSDQIALLEANIRRNIAYAIMILFALVNIMTLLAATTVQLGTVMVIMTRFIFKAPVDASLTDGEED